MIALTGGMGSGKSTIADHLRRKGIKVLDLDKIGHEALEDEMVKKKLVDAFGDGILRGDKIDRKKLGKIVFSDRAKLKQLNSIVHPKMLEILWKKVEDCPENLVVVDGAVIIDIGIHDRFDFVIVADVDTEIQIERIMKRDGITRDEAIRRVRLQVGREERLKHADFVVNTALPYDELRKRIDELIRIIERRVKERFI